MCVWPICWRDFRKNASLFAGHSNCFGCKSTLYFIFFMMCYMALKCCHYRRLRMRLYNNRQGGENDYDNLQPWGFKESILGLKCSFIIEKYLQVSFEQWNVFHKWLIIHFWWKWNTCKHVFHSEITQMGTLKNTVLMKKFLHKIFIFFYFSR